MKEKPTLREREIVAHLLDRAEQYDASSSIVTILTDLAYMIANGAALEAANAGKLDDLYKYVDRMIQ